MEQPVWTPFQARPLFCAWKERVTTTGPKGAQNTSPPYPKRKYVFFYNHSRPLTPNANNVRRFRKTKSTPEWWVLHLSADWTGLLPCSGPSFQSHWKVSLLRILFCFSLMLMKAGAFNATEKQNPRFQRGLFIYLRTGRDSNPRPPPWQGGILTSWTTNPFPNTKIGSANVKLKFQS